MILNISAYIVQKTSTKRRIQVQEYANQVSEIGKKNINPTGPDGRTLTCKSC